MVDQRELKVQRNPKIKTMMSLPKPWTFFQGIQGLVGTKTLTGSQWMAALWTVVRCSKLLWVFFETYLKNVTMASDGLMSYHNCEQCWPMMVTASVNVTTVGLRNHVMAYVATVGLRHQTGNVRVIGLCSFLVNLVFKAYKKVNVETIGLEHYVVNIQTAIFKVMWSPCQCQQGRWWMILNTVCNLEDIPLDDHKVFRLGINRGSQ